MNATTMLKNTEITTYAVHFGLYLRIDGVRVFDMTHPLNYKK